MCRKKVIRLWGPDPFTANKADLEYGHQLKLMTSFSISIKTFISFDIQYCPG